MHTQKHTHTQHTYIYIYIYIYISDLICNKGLLLSIYEKGPLLKQPKNFLYTYSYYICTTIHSVCIQNFFEML